MRETRANDTEAPGVAHSEQDGLENTRLLTQILRVGLGAMTALVFASIVAIAAAHVSDRYNVNHVSGTWIALAQDARHGTLYRPLFEHGVFGGTWYMPLQFVLQAGASLVTGEYLVSGKLLEYSIYLAIIVLTFALVRRAGCSRLVSAALTSVVVLAPAGELAATTIRGDALPLLLQLAAMAIVARWTSRRSLVFAGILCALAVTAKLAAVWAPAAILLWLFFRNRKQIWVFAGTLAAALILVGGAFETASDGRMSDTLLAVGVSGNSGASSPFSGVPRLFDFTARTTGPVWLLLPFAAAAIGLAATQRRLTLYQVALLVQVPLLAVILADPGSDFNHLVDFVVVAVLVTGEFWGRFGQRGAEFSMVGILMALALLLGAANTYRESMKSDTADALKVLVGRAPNTTYPTHALQKYLAPRDRILSEDPAIPVFLGRRPLFLDASSMRRVGINHPAWLNTLKERLARRRFDKVVLIHPVQDNAWYKQLDFGTPIQRAIETHYRLLVRQPGRPLSYWVYVPRKN